MNKFNIHFISGRGGCSRCLAGRFPPEFMQRRKACAPRQPSNTGVEQKTHMLCCHFVGHNLKERVIFGPRTHEVDFDGDVHDFHQTWRQSLTQGLARAPPAKASWPPWGPRAPGWERLL